MNASLLSLLSLVLAAPATGQSTWHVDPTGSAPGTGSTQAPYTSLQYAIDQGTTLAGDELLLHPGLYTETVDLRGKELRVLSLEGPELTVLDAGGVETALIAENQEGPATLVQGLTITGGSSSIGRGDGVRVLGGSFLTLRDCHIRDNSPSGSETHSGNGMFVEDSTVHLEDCMITGNVGGSLPGAGAGILSFRGDLTLLRTTLADNFGSYGGGLQLRGGNARLEECTIRNCYGNTSGAGAGGGIHALPDYWARVPLVLEIEGCHFEDNYAYDYGGGIHVESYPEATSTVSVRNTTFLRNWADLFGGGIHSEVEDGSVLIEDCSFRRNTLNPAFTFAVGSAISVGGAAQVAGCTFYDQQLGSAVALGPDVTFEHCTVVGNQTPSAVGPRPAVEGGLMTNCIVYDNEGPSFSLGTATYSNIEGGWPGVGNIDVDPLLVEPGVGDLRLRPLSPCIDAGNPSSPLDSDGTVADQGALPHDQTDPCPTPELFCVPKLHSGGCEPSLVWSGTPSVGGRDDFQVTAQNLLPGQFALAFVSPEPNHVPLFGGTRCTGPGAVRFGPYTTGLDAGSCSGEVVVPIDQAFLQGHGPATLLHIQVLFRDPGLAAPENVGLTGGLRFVVCP